MLATAATTRLARYRALQERMPDPQRVLKFGISGIVARIESGTVADDAFDDIFDAYLAPYHGMKADGIVLGCTHYIFIARAVERYFKNTSAENAACLTAIRQPFGSSEGCLSKAISAISQAAAKLHSTQAGIRKS